jgi:segregation and condensation protein B
MNEEDKRKIEAILFTTGKYTEIEEIARVCELGSIGYVKQVLTALQKEYEEKATALHILQEGTKYRLNIKNEYGLLANKLVSSGEFDAPTTKTLAVIAHRKPALQSDIIKIRGNKAYDHISQLKEEALITSERHGRTRNLKLTQKFYEYFDTAAASVKEIFKDLEGKVKEKEAAKAGMTVHELEEKKKMLEEKEHQKIEEGIPENFTVLPPLEEKEVQ